MAVMSDRRLPGADLRTLLRPALPTRSSAQALAEDFIPALLAARPGATVVDLGCGRGDSVDAFRAADPTVRWIGVEVGDSEYETRPDVELRIFDGIALPFEDASVDIVFSKQVLEHVERPHELIADVARVLAPGGIFVGSTSHLEPYHGRSTMNLTPYGLLRMLRDLRARPGDDHARHRRPDAARPARAARTAVLRPLLGPALPVQHRRRRRRAGHRLGR